MASPIIIPFDNNPISTTVKSASYTIPAGKYAKITVQDEAYDPVSTLAYSIVNTSSTFTLLNTDIGLCINGSLYFLYSFKVQLDISTTVQSAQRNLTVNLPANYVNYTGYATWSLISNAGFLGGDGIYVFKIKETDHVDVGSFAYGSGRLTSLLLRTTKQNASGTTAMRAVIQNTRTDVNTVSPIWVPSGTVISCPSFGRYIVEEYNQIS
jgi:hypothetical protein